MIIYLLQAMRRRQAKPTTLMSQNYNGQLITHWSNILPISYFPKKVLDDGSTVYMTVFSQPLIRPKDWLFWIERADQPAWHQSERSEK